MAKEIRKKSSFGSCNADHISPPPKEDAPKGINIVVGFEEALKLHLAIGQALAHLNSLDRSTKAGKSACVNICLFPASGYMTVTQATLKAKK